MYQLGGLVVTLVNGLLGLILWRRLRAAFPRHGALISGLCAAGLLLAALPALLMAAASFSGLRALQRHAPEPLALIAMGAQVGLLLYGVLLGLATLASAAVRALRRLQPPRNARPAADAQPATNAQASAGAQADPAAQAIRAPAEVEARPEAVDERRRRLVVGATWALPAAAVAVSMGGVLASRQRPAIVRLALPVRRELTSLHGVTIAQLSDVHVGSFMDAERLDELRDAMNAIRADIHVVTGDLLDHHVSQLELSARLLRGLRPARGQLFFCMGNHEYIAARSASVGTIVKGLEEAGAQVLVDEAREVRLGGDRLWMGAIDYPSRARPGEPARRPTRDGLDRALGQMRDDGAPRVLLSHHPGTFRAARELPFDLMLSGHTHGGQISLGRIGDYALTPMLPAGLYHNGHYEHRGRRLHVNAGAGGWLPVRINCPPEITLVELVPA
ncbi:MULTISPECIES: metallophosphoesterase [Sorangium]|uniref:Integral membrane protein n=1 Tax=Sorangium cellulosum (strain So ce56) TaxID=448385 RepID=A9GUT0_SORC5|nr:metallophosphoesterase [Sorangium cellulosum]CAN90663.1 putative integral membrane protein [Sorangium cellulosum So ce56]